ncbi:MAG: DHH family phosphoesterase, partial [Lachnospiraceae bacterium]|nr:DHH family phosphoesterase [Lachnospiraceae bacterium]
MSKWMISAKKADFNRIAQTFHLSPITARLLRNRGLVEESEIAAYLNCEEGGLRDPFLLPDVERAVSILQDKLREKKKIRIIGDYDVDGICSSYILWKVLNGLQAEVDVVLPHRIRDGYGISTLLVDQAKKDGVDTILTCDNGIAARDQVKHAKEVGMTVIVSDHHDVPKEGSGEDLLPEADAVVNPKRADSSYPFHDICGAVVAFKWMQVLLH